MPTRAMPEEEWIDDPGVEPEAAVGFRLSKGVKKRGQIVLLYGAGGIGKTTLASKAPSARFIDVEGGTDSFDDIDRIEPEEGTWSFPQIRSALNDMTLWEGVETIVMDSATKIEELVSEHVVRTVSHENGSNVDNIEKYGWGKGYKYIHDHFLLLVSDIRRHVLAGRNIILTAHDCVVEALNPMGENFIRYEPRLQDPKKGVSSIRLRLKEEADHVLFMAMDISVSSKTGKARGGASRTIYTTPAPTHMAKSRTLRNSIVCKENDDLIWRLIFGKEQEK